MPLSPAPDAAEALEMAQMYLNSGGALQTAHDFAQHAATMLLQVKAMPNDIKRSVRFLAGMQVVSIDHHKVYKVYLVTREKISERTWSSAARLLEKKKMARKRAGHSST